MAVVLTLMTNQRHESQRTQLHVGGNASLAPCWVHYHRRVSGPDEGLDSGGGVWNKIAPTHFVCTQASHSVLQQIYCGAPDLSTRESRNIVVGKNRRLS